MQDGVCKQVLEAPSLCPSTATGSAALSGGEVLHCGSSGSQCGMGAPALGSKSRCSVLTKPRLSAENMKMATSFALTLQCDLLTLTLFPCPLLLLLGSHVNIPI